MDSDSSAPVALRIKLRYDSIHTFVDNFAVNVNRVGMFLRSPAPKPVGTRVLVDLRLSDETPVIECEGIVRWIRKYDPNFPDRENGMGIEFQDLTLESLEIIELLEEARVQMGLPQSNTIPKTEDEQPAEETPAAPAVAETAQPAAAEVPESPPAAPPPEDTTASVPEIPGEPEIHVDGLLAAELDAGEPEDGEPEIHLDALLDAELDAGEPEDGEPEIHLDALLDEEPELDAGEPEDGEPEILIDGLLDEEPGAELVLDAGEPEIQIDASLDEEPGPELVLDAGEPEDGEPEIHVDGLLEPPGPVAEPALDAGEPVDSTPVILIDALLDEEPVPDAGEPGEPEIHLDGLLDAEPPAAEPVLDAGEPEIYRDVLLDAEPPAAEPVLDAGEPEGSASEMQAPVDPLAAVPVNPAGMAADRPEPLTGEPPARPRTRVELPEVVIPPLPRPVPVAPLAEPVHRRPRVSMAQLLAQAESTALPGNRGEDSDELDLAPDAFARALARARELARQTNDHDLEELLAPAPAAQVSAGEVSSFFGLTSAPSFKPAPASEPVAAPPAPAQPGQNAQEPSYLATEPETAPNLYMEAEQSPPAPAVVNAEPALTVDAEPAITVDAEPALTVDAEPELTADAEPATYELTADAEPATYELATDVEPALATDAEPATYELTMDAEPELTVDAEPGYHDAARPALEETFAAVEEAEPLPDLGNDSAFLAYADQAGAEDGGLSEQSLFGDPAGLSPDSQDGAIPQPFAENPPGSQPLEIPSAPGFDPADVEDLESVFADEDAHQAVVFRQTAAETQFGDVPTMALADPGPAEAHAELHAELYQTAGDGMDDLVGSLQDDAFHEDADDLDEIELLDDAEALEIDPDLLEPADEEDELLMEHIARASSPGLKPPPLPPGVSPPPLPLDASTDDLQESDGDDDDDPSKDPSKKRGFFSRIFNK